MTGPGPNPIATARLPLVVGSAVGFVLLGFALGAGGSFLQARTVGLGLRWPIGSVFAVVVLAAVTISAGLVARSRLGPGMVSVGWLVSVLMFTSARAEGDVIIAADTPGYLYLFGGALTLAVVSTVPYSALEAAGPA